MENHLPPLGSAFWQDRTSPGTAGNKQPYAAAEHWRKFSAAKHPEVQIFDLVSLQLENPSSV